MQHKYFFKLHAELGSQRRRKFSREQYRGRERAGWWRIRQNTAIYGYVNRTAQVLFAEHKDNFSQGKKMYGLIFVNKINKI